jgi:hypothetical protein
MPLINDEYAVPSHQYRAGIGHVGSYQVSGRPWITGSTNVPGAGANNGEQRIQFPYITKSFTVINKAAVTLYIHFVSRGDTASVINNRHYISLESINDSMTFDVKCKEVYISLESAAATGQFQLIADLTGIHPDNMQTLSGSGINT